MRTDVLTRRLMYPEIDWDNPFTFTAAGYVMVYPKHVRYLPEHYCACEVGDLCRIHDPFVDETGWGIDELECA